MKLYDYFRSTASYRVRIALALKALSYEKIEIHLLRQGGEQHHATYQAVNPQSLVPGFEDGTLLLSQSLAIIEYLEERYPEPALLPEDMVARAKARMLAQIIACDIHPLNNLRVLNQLKGQFQAKEEDIQVWYHHWLQKGFQAIEHHLAGIERHKAVCIGNSFSIADICLIPQVFNAKRFEFPLDEFPLIQQINEYCLRFKAFQIGDCQ